MVLFESLFVILPLEMDGLMDTECSGHVVGICAYKHLFLIVHSSRENGKKKTSKISLMLSLLWRLNRWRWAISDSFRLVADEIVRKIRQSFQWISFGWFFCCCVEWLELRGSMWLDEVNVFRWKTLSGFKGLKGWPLKFGYGVHNDDNWLHSV